MLRDDLRRHTHEHHERLEALLDLPGSIRSTDDYRRLLGAFFGFYTPFEARLGEYEEPLGYVGLDVSARRKAPRLRDDLEALGFSDESIEALPRCSTLPALDSWGQALGALYVLEGSTLGGQFIVRHLSRDWPALPTRFFAGYGERTGAMWRNFLAVLNDQPIAAGEREAILQGAEATFEALAHWFTGALGRATPVADERPDPAHLAPAPARRH